MHTTATDPTREESAARTTEPGAIVRDRPAGRPRHVGLVCLSPQADGGTPRLLLNDLAEATRVYESHYGSGKDELELFGVGRPEDAARADALVLALASDDGGLPSDVAPELQRISEATQLGTRVYAVVCCGFHVSASHGLAQTDQAAHKLEAWCGAHDLTWSGAVVVTGSDLLPTIWGSPRLGWLRRPTSEAIDGLILALRSGQDAGVICVRQRAACRLWALLARAGRRA